MKSNPKLSILIPTYNREKFIVNTIESVLNQDFEDYEIICSDNSSSDRTYEILQEYSLKYSQIKIFQNKENLGPVLNWKRCLDNASGEYIHWLWSDDWIESNFYVDAFNLMKEDDTKIVSSWNYRSDNIADLNDKYQSWQFSFPYIEGKIAAKKILLGTYELPLSPAAYIIPVDLVRKHFYTTIPKLNDKLNPVKKAVGVDSLMIIGACLDVENISILQKPSVVFRQHDNISSSLSKDGSLSKMYLLSHLWFISENKISLNILEYLFILRKTFQVFSIKEINYKILRYLMRILLRLENIIKSQFSIFDYNSKKALLKEVISVKLSKKLLDFNLENKKIYLSPYNNVTVEIYKKFIQQNPKNVTFIDNFKEGNNITSSKEIQSYDYIFIYSPNYELEIAKTLPKENLFLLKQSKKDFYDVRKFSKINNIKYLFKSCQKLFNLRSDSLFNIGTKILSEDMKKNDFSNTVIYLAPYNKLTREVAGELKRYNNSITIRYIDNMYKNDDILNYHKLDKYDFIFIDKSSLKNKFVNLLPTNNKFFLSIDIKNKISIFPYNHINLIKQNIKNYIESIYLNSIFKTRLFFASNFNLYLHSNEKRLLDLKNKYVGKRAFILGNGPSLKINDLDMLQNEITFAANKIYLAYNETKWRPTFYSIEDNLVMNEIYDDVVKLEGTTLIFPIKDYKVTDNSIYYPLKKNSGGFSPNMLKGLYPGHTVTYSMLQMAVYMGIKEIYFIGLDFSYELPSNIKNETDIIYHEKELNHFHKDYRKPGDKWIKPNVDAQLKAYRIAKDFCDKNDIKIYNASRSTKLKLFPLIDFDELF